MAARIPERRWHIGVLGPVAIATGNGAVPVTSGRARSLLVSLVLAHPRPVTVTGLVEDAWPDGPPRNPHGAVQTQISRLRRLLGTDTIAASAAGYRLKVDEPISDLAVAEEFSDDTVGDTTAAALCLWRGDPGADLPAGDLRTRLIMRADRAYHRLRVANWRSRLTTDPGAVARELEAVRTDRPLDEHLAALHMRACLAAGDPNTALRIHTQTSSRLASALGADPGPELAAAHSAALRYSPLPHTPAPPADDYLSDGQPIAELSAALQNWSIVTVLGPGGIGKTRLVAEYIAAYSPPNILVDLSAARHPDDVTAAVAAALGWGSVPEQGSASSLPAEAVTATVTRLAPTGALIVLDGGEQLRGFVRDLIDDVRIHRADLTILVTSRSVLDMPGEFVLHLQPLTPEVGAELIEKRIRLHRKDAQLDPVLLDELCRRLDGSPLALELAAAQLRHLSLRDVLAGLESRFDLLTSPGAGRHQALADVVATSWNILPDNARRSLEVLAALPGEVRINDATTFTSVTPATLGHLCDHSLAIVVDRPDGITRYRITETVREFTRARTAARSAADRATLQRELVSWAADLVADVGNQLMGRTPLDTAHRAGARRGIDVAGALVRLDESTDAVLSIIDAVTAGSAPNDAAAVARLLPITLWRVVRTGAHPGIDKIARAALAASNTHLDVLGLACATAYLTALGHSRDAARARGLLRRLARPAELPAPVTMIVEILCSPVQNIPHTLTRAARSPDEVAAALAELARSDIAEFAAAPWLSRRSALRALVFAERAEHPWLIAAARHRLGRGHLLLGDTEGAATLFAQSADEFATLGFVEESSRIRVHQALALSARAPDTATDLLEACLREFADSGQPFVATAYAALAQIRLDHDPSGARRGADAACDLIGAPRDGHSAYLHGVRAVILHRSGAHTAARLAADSLRVSLSHLVAAPTVNLPALGAAAAAIALVGDKPTDDPLTVAARGARYRRDFGVIDLGDGPHSSRTALLRLAR